MSRSIKKRSQDQHVKSALKKTRPLLCFFHRRRSTLDPGSMVDSRPSGVKHLDWDVRPIHNSRPCFGGCDEGERVVAGELVSRCDVSFAGVYPASGSNPHCAIRSETNSNLTETVGNAVAKGTNGSGSFSRIELGAFNSSRVIPANLVAGSSRSKFPSCCDHLHRPALYECSEAVERLGEIVAGGGKAQAEMRGHIEAIAGSQQDSTLSRGLAKRAVVLSAH